MADANSSGDAGVGDPAPLTSEAEAVQELRVDVRPSDAGLAIVGVSGELDMLTAPQLAQRLREPLDTSAGVVLDLGGVGFLGSAGLAVLADAQRRAAKRDVPFALVAHSHAVLRPLEVTALDQALTVYPDLDTALANLKQA
ncbi:MAG: STAS domain-containing protein [Sciscionella sp.]|nr:STAS domain-containing protein [Sciscionella sp.]